MPFVAVVDPRIQPPKLERMRRLGATIEMVRTPDADGSFLDARLARVAELCADDERRWCPNQYDNWANPAVHRETTATEIGRQTDGAVEWVVAAVSTGGTLRGVLDGLTAMGLRPRGLAVDAVGSRALGGPAGPRHLTGIGSSRRSTFLTPDGVDRVVHVGDGDAFAECWRFRHDTGVALGASSGAVLAAARQLLAEEEVGVPPICIAADGGEDYDSTLYHRRWLGDVGHEQAAAVDGPGRWRESAWPSATP